MLNLLKILSKVDVNDTEYNGYQDFAEYYHTLQDLYREFAVELEYNLAPIQGSEAKVQYIEGLQQAINVSVSFAQPKVISLLRYITQPTTEQGGNPNKKRRITITIEDSMPTYIQLSDIEVTIHRNESNGYWDMDSNKYILLTCLQIHVYHIEAVDFLLKNRIRQIKQGKNYVPLLNPATIDSIAQLDIKEKYPYGVMSRAEVMDYLNISKSTITRYANEGKIAPIDPTAKSHVYTTEAVLRLMVLVGRGNKKRK